MEHVADLNWPLALAAYGAYRTTRLARKKYLTYTQMPTKRGYNQAFQVAAGGAPRRFKARKGSKRKNVYPMYRPINRYNPRFQHNDRKIVSLKLLRQHNLVAGTDFFSVIKTEDVLDCEGWNRYAGLYDRFRLVSMKIQFHPSDHVTTALTYVQQDDSTLMNVKTAFMKQMSLYTHNLKSQERTCQRTLRLGAIPTHREFIKTDAAVANLENTTVYDSSIKYMFLAAHGIAGADANPKVDCIVTFVVEFAGFTDTTALD